MNTTTLPGGTEHHLADRGDQARVLAGDDEEDPGLAIPWDRGVFVYAV
ncbi:hypothetical protein [Streptomyces sp. YIM 121038]|nr:hypothetical protein [Streptomyces sp. YIM 121038]